MTTARISVTPETKTEIREFAKGLGATYDTALQFLMDFARSVQPDEDPLIVGRKLRDQYVARYPSDTGEGLVE